MGVRERIGLNFAAAVLTVGLQNGPEARRERAREPSAEASAAAEVGDAG